METKRRLMTINEVADELQTTRQNVYALVRKGILKKYKLVGRTYFKREELNEMIDNL